MLTQGADMKELKNAEWAKFRDFRLAREHLARLRPQLKSLLSAPRKGAAKEQERLVAATIIRRNLNGSGKAATEGSGVYDKIPEAPPP